MKLGKAIFTASLLLIFTGCLKTRNQIRDNSSDDIENPPVQAKAVQDVAPDGKYAVDEMKSEITQLEGRVEDLERSHKDMEKDQKNLITRAKEGDKESLAHIEERFTKLDEALADAADRLKKLEDAAVVADPAQVWDQAKKEFKQENYQKALDHLTIYAKNSKNKNYQDAIYMKGECYYKLKQYKKAIVEFSKFPEHFSKAARMPEALYQIALSFDALNMKEDAQGFYQEILEKFPKSAEAKKAKKKKKK